MIPGLRNATPTGEKKDGINLNFRIFYLSNAECQILTWKWREYETGSDHSRMEEAV